MVMKQAIQYNLAGNAENEQDEVVRFTLQGDAKRLNPAIAAIREGTKKSSNIEVATTPRLLRAECAYKGRLGIVRSRGEGQRSSASRKRVCRSLLPANRLRGAPPLAVISGYSARCNLSFLLIVLGGPCD
jgi:acylphosphatase